MGMTQHTLISIEHVVNTRDVGDFGREHYAPLTYTTVILDDEGDGRGLTTWGVENIAVSEAPALLEAVYEVTNIGGDAGRSDLRGFETAYRLGRAAWGWGEVRSLSVGDRVTIHFGLSTSTMLVTFEVKGHGFERVATRFERKAA